MAPLAAPIFRKGLDVKHLVADELARDYHSQFIDQIRDDEFTHREGRLTVRLAQEFGFCYGVDRADDYAYQTRRKFPDRTVWLTGEIIHNPQVNTRLRDAGIRFLSDGGESVDHVGPDDVVILPAFGVTVSDLAELDRRGCTLVDTTCGSVLNVWKNVRRYARDGYTSVIHGKIAHEETQATASQAGLSPGGRYAVVRDEAEAQLLCERIRGAAPPEAFMERLGHACSFAFDSERDLQKVGLANQTTMLMSESLQIGEMVRQAMVDRYGDVALSEHYRAFDTICSATQDRQDAIVALLDAAHLDLMIAIGGYNSSNTRNLARIGADRIPTYHIADPTCLESAVVVRHLPASSSPGRTEELVARDWLPAGPVAVGVTAGASTPDTVVGAVIERLVELTRGNLS